ncbi:MAG: hypothetical protein AAF198_08755, partial [Pseudomonadota bacterium]
QIEKFANLDDLGDSNPSEELIEALKDDLNTSLAITHLERQVSSSHGTQLANDLIFLGLETKDTILKKIALRKEARSFVEPFAFEIKRMRDEAKLLETKEEKSAAFAELDELKAKLSAAGFGVQMGAEEVTIKLEADFDISKLETLR